MHELDDSEAMKIAIAAAELGIMKGQTPFGACLVSGGKVVARAHNSVWRDLDITAHAEIMVLREACRALGTVNLAGSIIYSTCEPCPMCYSACHWAGIGEIVYGAAIQDAKDFGFNELPISNKVMSSYDPKRMIIRGGVLRDDCVALFNKWSQRKDRRSY